MFEILSLWPYHPEYALSCLISEAMQGWVWLVLERNIGSCSAHPQGSSHVVAMFCTEGHKIKQLFKYYSAVMV